MANYIEYVALPKRASDECFVIDYTLDDAAIMRLISALQSRNIKSYERKIKRYTKKNLVYEVILDHKDEICDIRSCTMDACDYKSCEDNRILMISYNKSKKPIHAFSSSNDLNDVSYIKRLTFRVSNRLFINIDVTKSVDDTEYKKAFMNVNIDQNVDRDYLDSEVQQYLRIMSSALDVR